MRESQASAIRIANIIDVHRANPETASPCGMHRRWEDCLIMEAERLTDALRDERRTKRRTAHGRSTRTRE
jgi:hypothetical protein